MIKIRFCLGESLYTIDRVVDYMLAVDDHGNALFDDAGEFLLYAEVVKTDDEFDEDGNEINPFVHYGELMDEIKSQADEKGITEEIDFKGE